MPTDVCFLPCHTDISGLHFGNLELLPETCECLRKTKTLQCAMCRKSTGEVYNPTSTQNIVKLSGTWSLALRARPVIIFICDMWVNFVLKHRSLAILDLDLTQTTQPFSCRALPPELTYVEGCPLRFSFGRMNRSPYMYHLQFKSNYFPTATRVHSKDLIRS